ncbi:coenzyme PQQ precursor peptide PqqA [Streptomyces noursei ATCC 11455]|nr:coenzyme PQQ precursor peptide PqqA [Streptomyces noursei ATCC 11455]
MNSATHEVSEQSPGTVVAPAQPGAPDPTAAPSGEWRTPGYTVVETALEVTAYALNTR